MSKRKHIASRPWTEADRFAFATQRLRAQTIPAGRSNGPTVDEWDDDTDDWGD